MGKAARKRNAGNSKHIKIDNKSTKSNGGVDLDITSSLKRAFDLKEEGNKRFQSKDYARAIEHYNDSLKLVPEGHPDSAVLHSNKAACLMQMHPVDYDAVISECSTAIQVNPHFTRALLRRARAFEAVGNHEMAMKDVQSLLTVVDPSNPDALAIFLRLQAQISAGKETQSDNLSTPSTAAHGDPPLPSAPPVGLCLELPIKKSVGNGVFSASSMGFAAPVSKVKLEKPQSNFISENTSEKPSVVLDLDVEKPKSTLEKDDVSKLECVESQPMGVSCEDGEAKVVIQWRPLKLVYGHDIRLAKMPVDCSFKTLREVVGKHFPTSKSVLIKYKDSDDDLVTLTRTYELRLAELHVDSLLPKEHKVDGTKSASMLRLHVVDVAPEQEPSVLEDMDDKFGDNEALNIGEYNCYSTSSVPVSGAGTSVKEKTGVRGDPVKKSAITQSIPHKKPDIDDWLYEFYMLFQNHAGIDPDAHIDLNEIGMELCSEALEDTLTSDDAQVIFEKAALKFQEVVALALFNWGNVYMCAARKKIPIDDSSEELMTSQLMSAYDWVKGKYSLAREKYEEALAMKPDFYEVVLALGQQEFEMAKLEWSFYIVKKVDFSSWDSSKLIELFDSSMDKMKLGTEMFEKSEQKRIKEINDGVGGKVGGLLKKVGTQEGSDDSVRACLEHVSSLREAEQASIMQSQIHLFWGNMLFERSQVEFTLGHSVWKKNLDAAVERFKLTGISESEISLVVQNHVCNDKKPMWNEKDDRKPVDNTQTAADSNNMNGE